MNTALIEAVCTDVVFPEMPDKHGYELINGEWVEKKMGAEAGRVVQTVNSLVNAC
jgi:hypothetical protein